VGAENTTLAKKTHPHSPTPVLFFSVEDTDAARSTKESEAAVLRDLAWLGIKWDEGPDVGGPAAPYRQSERAALYRTYVDRLVEEGRAYPCFCTDDEITAMKAEAEAKSLPPIYRGKWASASPADVEAELAKGTPCCYRFRVPPNRDVVVKDVIRGDVKFNTGAVGDFVVLRSNGLPVYNFCVAVDDALMGITHVIRAEEHLPNTLRQLLIFDALGFAPPTFGHVSLILAPDKSKLSKRHGATSVGEFREQGFLADAMVNYLALLGWNDGTEQEIFTRDELSSKFSLDRITKSAAVFDKTKLAWMNGQHLRALPDAELTSLVAGAWVEAGLLARADSPFARAAVAIVKTQLELVTDGEAELRRVLAYPLADTLASDAAATLVEDGLRDVAAAVVAAADAGELGAAVAGGADGVKAWIKAFGKATERKGKRLFMPLRVVLTGRTAGAEVADQLALLAGDVGDVVEAGAVVPLADRVEALRAWVAAGGAEE
jgi:glutamyl-tRNA synthetase